MKSLDESLLFYFVRKILEMTEGPYSVDFYELMLKLMEPVTINLESALDTKPLAEKFLGDAPDLLERSLAIKTLTNLQKTFRLS